MELIRVINIKTGEAKMVLPKIANNEKLLKSMGFMKQDFEKESNDGKENSLSKLVDIVDNGINIIDTDLSNKKTDDLIESNEIVEETEKPKRGRKTKQLII